MVSVVAFLASTHVPVAITLTKLCNPKMSPDNKCQILLEGQNHPGLKTTVLDTHCCSVAGVGLWRGQVVGSELPATSAANHSGKQSSGAKSQET